jgi:hypothetical protein
MRPQADFRSARIKKRCPNPSGIRAPHEPQLDQECQKEPTSGWWGLRPLRHSIGGPLPITLLMDFPLSRLFS